MGDRQARERFSGDASSAAPARRFVDGTLTRWGLAELVEVAVLLTSELVANAVLHSDGEIDLLVTSADRRVRVEVHDENPSIPARKFYSELATTGRGLFLVDELSSAWGADETATGKVVWFELAVAAASLHASHAGAGGAHPQVSPAGRPA